VKARSRDLLERGLRFDNLAVGVAPLEQLGVRADADDSPVVQDDDAIGIDDSADALRDDEDGGVGRPTFNAARNLASVVRSSAEKLSSNT